jgi:L-threonylcarbamoyladenylate synthase
MGDSLTLLRPGAITPEMLREICPNVSIDGGVFEKLPEGTAPLAPGMKYRHYAPRAKVYLIKDAGGEDFDSRVTAFLQEKLREDPETGILCFDEYAEVLTGKNVLTFGKKDDEKAHSHLLFDRLRHFDETDATVIYATAGSTEGIGLALYNRMLKAAGYTVLNI